MLGGAISPQPRVRGLPGLGGGPGGEGRGPPRERQGRGRPFPPCPGQGGGASGAAGGWPPLSPPGKAKPQRLRSLGSPGAGGRRRLSGAPACAAPHAARAAGSALAAAALVVVCVGGLAAAGSPPWGGRAGAAEEEEEAAAAAAEQRPAGPMEEREGEVRWDGLCSRDAAARDAALDTIGQAVLRRAESFASGAAANGLPVPAARDGLGEALARLLMLSKRCPFPDVREKSAAILSGVQVSAAHQPFGFGTGPGALPAPFHPGCLQVSPVRRGGRLVHPVRFIPAINTC